MLVAPVSEVWEDASDASADDRVEIAAEIWTGVAVGTGVLVKVGTGVGVVVGVEVGVGVGGRCSVPTIIL